MSKQKKWSSCAFSMARGITNDCCEKKKMRMQVLRGICIFCFAKKEAER